MNEQDWIQNAACRGYDVNIFVAPEGIRGGVLRKNYDTALAICKQCSVKQECLDYAIENEMLSHGIFGGTTPRTRTLLVRKQRRLTRGRNIALSPDGNLSAHKA